MNAAQARLLVVDDNEDNRYTLGRRLNRLGYARTEFANGDRRIGPDPLEEGTDECGRPGPRIDENADLHRLTRWYLTFGRSPYRCA